MEQIGQFIPLAVILLVVYLVLKIATKMADARGRSATRWGAASLLFSPLLTFPILLFLPKLDPTDPPSNKSEVSVEIERTSKMTKKIGWFLAATAVAFVAALNSTNATLEQGFGDLLKDNDLKKYSVSEVKSSVGVMFGGRNSVDLFVQDHTGELTRLEALVIGSPLTSYYMEIPGVELLKLQ